MGLRRLLRLRIRSLRFMSSRASELNRLLLMYDKKRSQLEAELMFTSDSYERSALESRIDWLSDEIYRIDKNLMEEMWV